MRRLAVILFNLGGPDSLEAVKPFLRNLFSDPAILTVPAPVRFFLSRYIAGRREAPARAAYEQLGGVLAAAGADRGTGPGARSRTGGAGPGGALLHRDALLASACRGGASGGSRLPAGRDRGAAALSAVLDHHFGLIACRMAETGRRGRGVAGTLLPSPAGGPGGSLGGSSGRSDPPRARRRPGPRAVHRAWPAGAGDCEG